jgi:SIR2-like domain
MIPIRRRLVRLVPAGRLAGSLRGTRPARALGGPRGPCRATTYSATRVVTAPANSSRYCLKAHIDGGAGRREPLNVHIPGPLSRNLLARFRDYGLWRDFIAPMTVRTIDSSQVLSLQEHLAKAAALDDEKVTHIRDLAAQLEGRSVMPVLGAGASYDCGMRLASQIGEDLCNDYLADASFAPHAARLSPNLGDVADAIFAAADQPTVVRAVGLPDPALWPGTDEVNEHFCAYRVLARLAREDLMHEAITFNYDCGHEAGLKAEGFLRSARTELGKEWLDHATVIADAATHAQLHRAGAFTLFKAHGCAERYRGLAVADENAAADTIIIRRLQLTTWRNDAWIRDTFADRARNHVLLLIGFSGQDPVIYGEMASVLDGVRVATSPNGLPRVVVIDHEPDTATLRTLISSGLGGQDAPRGAVTQIGTSSATTTSVMLVLLAEALALKLAPVGVTLPDEMEPRLAALTLSAPIMLRWSYLLRKPAENQYVQRINLQQAAEHGYVPLTLDPQTTARALQTRAELRQELGLTEREMTGEALAAHGFLVDGGCAFLPVGLDHDELVRSCRLGGPIDLARRILGHPVHLDCILVSDRPGGRRGVNMETGKEVPVP